MFSIRNVSLAATLAVLAATSAAAVGLGPLRKSGITDGAGKIFYLTLINPYPQAERFTAQAHAALLEDPAPRVTIIPSSTTVAPGGRRQLLVVIRHLAPGETYAFRVCAQRPPRPEETVHARVCSNLSVRRLLSAASLPASGQSVYLPAPPSGPGGEDVIETASGARCRQAINSNGA